MHLKGKETKKSENKFIFIPDSTYSPVDLVKCQDMKIKKFGSLPTSCTLLVNLKNHKCQSFLIFPIDH